MPTATTGRRAIQLPRAASGFAAPVASSSTTVQGNIPIRKEDSPLKMSIGGVWRLLCRNALKHHSK